MTERAAQAVLQPGPRFDPNADYQHVGAIWFDVDSTLVDYLTPDLPSDLFVETAKQVGELAALKSIGLASARPISKTKHILEAIHAR